MEWWNNGVLRLKPNPPIFPYSKIPIRKGGVEKWNGGVMEWCV